MIKLKITAFATYDADINHYPGAKSAEDMAEMDLPEAMDILYNLAQENELKFKIDSV